MSDLTHLTVIYNSAPKMKIFMSLCSNTNSSAVITDCENCMMTSRQSRLIYIHLTSAKKTKMQSAHGSFIYKRLKCTTRYCRLSISELPHLAVITVVPKQGSKALPEQSPGPPRYPPRRWKIQSEIHKRHTSLNVPTCSSESSLHPRCLWWCWRC